MALWDYFSANNNDDDKNHNDSQSKKNMMPDNAIDGTISKDMESYADRTQARVDCQGTHRSSMGQTQRQNTAGLRYKEHYNDDFIRLDNQVSNIRTTVRELADKLDWIIQIIQPLYKQGQNTNENIGSEVLARLDRLTDQQQIIENQQQIIKRQHDAMLKYNDDVIYKIQKGLILEMISFADQVRMIIESKREDESYDLIQGLRELEESIEASLSNNSVRRYSETELDDTILNRRRQIAVGNESTENPDKNGYFKSVAPGYEWTMPYLVVNSDVKLRKILEENKSPQTFSFVIRPEEVVKLNYVKSVQDADTEEKSQQVDGCTDDIASGESIVFD